MDNPSLEQEDTLRSDESVRIFFRFLPKNNGPPNPLDRIRKPKINLLETFEQKIQSKHPDDWRPTFLRHLFVQF